MTAIRQDTRFAVDGWHGLERKWVFGKEKVLKRESNGE